MCSIDGAELRVPYDFRQGDMADAPVLLPLPDANGHIHTMMQFCQRICPGAPILAPRLDRLHAGGEPRPDATTDVRADHIAALIVRAVSDHGLALVPIVSVGHRDSADLGMCLTLRHGALLAASIMLSPSTHPAPAGHHVCDGLHVLLALPATEQEHGKVGWQIRNAMLKAGADVICETIPRRHILGPLEAAVARVFIAALFGDNRSKHDPNRQSMSL